MPSPVAIIDVGSNSIKLLVASLDDSGQLVTLLARTIDARISKGISKVSPRLSEEGMIAGLAAIRELKADAEAQGAPSILTVATSAVRDAENGAEFRARVLKTVGLEIRILTGEQEANLIGRGLVADPALSTLSDFYVFDLGGGSLECLTFKNRSVCQELSLRLGCVRLTERFITDPSQRLSAELQSSVLFQIKTELQTSTVRFELSEPAAVFAGGTMTCARAIFAAAQGQSLTAVSPRISVDDLRSLTAKVCSLSQNERPIALPGLPASRADVFPVALLTVLAIAEVAGLSHFHHSLYNLRYGLADELLRPKR